MKVTVVGAGFMGHGIGVMYALGEYDVTLVDSQPSALERAQAGAERTVHLLTELGVITPEAAVAGLRRLHYATDLAAACADTGLVQEAIPEVLAMKQELFALLEKLAPAAAILGTNTSSLRMTAIAGKMREPQRLVGIHWVSPPHIVPVVEIVRSDVVREDVVARAAAVMTGLGRIPVVVKDVPGFLINRLQSAYRNAALSLIEQGIASAPEIDAAVKYAIAPRQLAFGMFQMYDLVVNAKTSLTVGDYLYEATGEDKYRPSPLMRQMVEEGRLGLVAGRGWYDYTSLPKALVEDRRDKAFLEVYKEQRRLEPVFDVTRPADDRSA